MKIDLKNLDLFIWAVILACGYVVLFLFGIVPIFKDVISGKNIGLLLTVLSLGAAGYFVGNYFKKRCERKINISGKHFDCSSEGMAAFMLFIFFSAP